MEAWILATVLFKGAKPQISIHKDEAACVAAGEQWAREVEELRQRFKRPRPSGWLCTTIEEKPS